MRAIPSLPTLPLAHAPSLSRLATSLVLAGGLAGCSLVTPFGTFVIEEPDAAVGTDASIIDAGSSDAGTTDAGGRDGGLVDAGTPDARTSHDVGTPDAMVVVDAAMPMDTATDDARVVVTDDAWAADAAVDPDAYVSPPDAYVPDAYTAPDAYTSPDAFTPPDAYVPPDAHVTRRLTVTLTSGSPTGNTVELWTAETNTRLPDTTPCTAAGDCTFDLDPGTAVRIVITRAARWQGVTSWSVAGCAGPTCDVVVTADTTVRFTTGALGRVAFLTSRVFGGALSGSPMPAAAEADMLCSDIASTAGLPGAYVAFFSGLTPAESFATRFAGARGPWVRPDGTPLAATLADLLAARLLNPLSVDETGTRYADTSGTLVPWRWSNTRLDGSVFSTLASETCAGFTSTSGFSALGIAGSTASAGGDRWTAHTGNAMNCAGPAQLGCFQLDTTGTDGPVIPGPRPARNATLLFLSTESFAGNAGRAAMDTRCGADAVAAGLPGSYVALVGLAASSAYSRVSTRAFPWLRVDGHVAVRTLAEIDTTSPVVLRADGTRPATTDLRTWTGTGVTLDELNPSMTCTDWSSASSSQRGAYGDTTGNRDWSGASAAFCNTPQPVYCIRNG